MFRERLETNTSFKEVRVIYKLFLEYIESHYVFKSVFESIIFAPYATWLRAWMFVRKDDWSLRAKELVERLAWSIRVVIFPCGLWLPNMIVVYKYVVCGYYWYYCMQMVLVFNE